MPPFDDFGQMEPTKISYIDGRPTTITLRRCKLALKRGDSLKEYTYEQDVVSIGAMEDNDLVIDDVSTAEGNRKMYSRYLAKPSYAELVDRLKVQLARLGRQD